MANLKAIRKRIQGVTGTQQLTRAMKLVAAAKLRRAQESALAQRPYAEALGKIIGHLGERLEEGAHPLLAKRPMKKALLLLYSSDRGLCGAFNLNICRAAGQFIDAQGAEDVKVVVSTIGKKGFEYIERREEEIVSNYQDLFADTTFDNISRIGNELAAEYVEGAYDGLFVLYNQFKSAAVQRVTLKQVLPVSLEDVAQDDNLVEHIFEPDKQKLLDTVFPMYVNLQLFQALLESVASEMGARMTAMDNATSNAADLIKRLTLIYNKARQESITTELMDIVGGAEALS
jgi:F-type H+-transporting ATPase subunit gamma